MCRLARQCAPRSGRARAGGTRRRTRRGATLPVGGDLPFVPGRPRENSIDKPQVRITDASENPVTDEDRLVFDWGETICIKISGIVAPPGSEGFFGALTRSPIKATLH